MDQIFSAIASVIVVTSFLYQSYGIYLCKSAEQISWVFILLQLLVNIMYIYYDIYNQAWTLLLANGPIVIILIVIFLQKKYYSRQEYEMIE